MRAAAVSVVCVGSAPMAALAAGVPTIALTSTRHAALSDGKDSLEVIAEVRDSTGRFAVDGTVVTFTTNIGVFERDGSGTRAATRSGSARVRLSSQQKGTATVTAVVSGGGFQKLEVLFTDDPAETVAGASYVDVRSSGSLIYCAGERIIEAVTRAAADGAEPKPGAEVRFRTVTILAGRVQVDCTSNTVRATQDVRIARGKRSMRCAKLHYNLMTGVGFAVVEGERSLVPVKFSGMDLTQEPLETGVAPKFFEMTDLADARLVIVARQITLFPGEKLQFKRPRFYEDGQHLFSLAYYSLSLYSSQLFTDQLLSVGTQGVGLDVPLYYDLSPGSKGLVRVKYGERYGSAYARRPGWALDLLQGYNSMPGASRYLGEFGFTGMNRSDWGFRWNHSQEFSSATRTSLYVDFPQHRSVYGSSNLTQRLGNLQLGLSLAANTTLTGLSASGSRADAYVESTPAKLGRTGVMVAVGGNAGAARYAAGETRTSSATQGLHTRMFTPSIRLDRSTSLTNALSVGHVWTTEGRSGASVLAGVSAVRTLGGNRTLQANYDYVHQPLAASEGEHRLSLSFSSYGDRLGVYVYNTTVLDSDASSLVGDIQYSLARRWRFSVGASAQRFSDTSYTDLLFGLAHNVGGRDVVLSYSTYNRRFMLDLEATRF